MAYFRSVSPFEAVTTRKQIRNVKSGNSRLQKDLWF